MISLILFLATTIDELTLMKFSDRLKLFCCSPEINSRVDELLISVIKKCVLGKDEVVDGEKYNPAVSMILLLKTQLLRHFAMSAIPIRDAFVVTIVFAIGIIVALVDDVIIFLRMSEIRFLTTFGAPEIV